MNIINTFSVDFKVRDYECDLQGIVNNAVYMHYLEHARHEYLAHIGLDFKTLFDQGIALVVTRVEIQYKRSLRSGDVFIVTCQPVFESRYKVNFIQEIEKGAGEKMTRAVVTIAAIDRDRKPILINSIFSV